MKPTLRQEGFTLIELMIAITISLIVLAALTAMFVTSSRARDEITRANQQIESGRYAMQVLSDDLRLAGYFGGYLPPDPAAPANPPPDPCVATLAALDAALPLHIQGYDEGALGGHCGGVLTGYKAGTDIVVIRRVSTCVADDTDPTCLDDSGEMYFQASQCAGQIDDGANTNGFAYILSNSSTAGTFNRTTRDCATTAAKRRLMVHVYYIAELDHPTLMRAELRGGNFTTMAPIAEGIEEMEIRYGIDTDGDGAPDGAYVVAGNAGLVSQGDWRDVMSVEVSLLARSTDPSPGHTDTKTYNLAGANFTPGGSFKRHVFETTVRLSNPAGRRQQGG